MAMIMCPDCGTSISDKALTCPYCGYAGNDPATPIADQSIGYEVVPRIKMSIERWDPKSRSLTEETSEMPIQARRAVARWLGSLKDWESLQVVAPALVGFVKEFLGDDKVRMVADLPAEIMRMVKEGRLRFRPDSEGRIMPFVYDDKGIYKQVRLNMETVPPDVTNAMRQLETQAALSMVLAEVRSLRDQLEGIRIGLQNDRLALAEGAWDKLMQAREVEDSRLRDALIMQALSSATDAKRTLMRNFTQNANYLIEQSDIDLNRNPLALVRRLGESLNGNERIHQAAADAFDDLVQITNVVRVEGEGYSMLARNVPPVPAWISSANSSKRTDSMRIPFSSSTADFHPRGRCRNLWTSSQSFPRESRSLAACLWSKAFRRDCSNPIGLDRMGPLRSPIRKRKMNPFKKKTDVESRAASSSEQALCSVCRHAIPESRRELGLCLDCSTKKDRNKAVLAVGLAGGALAVAKKYGPKVVSKVGPLIVNAVKKIF